MGPTLIALSYPDDMSMFGLYGQKETDLSADRGATEKSVLWSTSLRKGHGRCQRLSGGDPLCRVLGPLWLGCPWLWGAPLEELELEPEPEPNPELEEEEDIEELLVNFKGKGNGMRSSLSLLGTSSAVTRSPVALTAATGWDSCSLTDTIFACAISAAFFCAVGFRDAGSRSHTMMVPSARPQHSCSGL